MADPRAIVRYDGIAENFATFKIDNVTITYDATKSGGSAGVFLAVGIVGNGIVQLVSDGQFVLGKLIRVQMDGFCSVQIGGVVLLPAGNGATVSANNSIVGALGVASAKGYVRNTVYTLLAEVASANGVILDASDTTNVACFLY